MEHTSGDLIRVADLAEEIFSTGQGPNNISILTMPQYVWKQKRNPAIELSVDRKIHFAHPARTERAQYFVRT